MKVKIDMIIELSLFLLIITTLSCDKSEANLAEQKLYASIREYQYHEKNVSDFSFLTKYKNLEALDLSGSGVKNLSFIKTLPKLELLILENTNIEKSEIDKNIYGNNFKYTSSFDEIYIKKDINNYYNILNKYHDLSFYLNNKILYYVENNINNEFSAGEVKELNFFKKAPIKFSNIIGILRFVNLETLKIILYNDNYIKYINQLKYLKELHLAGNVYNLPDFQKSLKKLYLYNTKVNDFSFLKNSNIEYLYIITKNYRDKKWNKLKKEFPNIKIKVKNLLWLPKYRNACYVKNYYLTNIESYLFQINEDKYYYFYTDNIYIYGNCKIIDKLRNNLIDFNLTRDNLVFLVDKIKININQLWDYSDWSDEKVTFLDIAIDNDDKDMIEFLFFLAGINKNSTKRSCEILNKKCAPVSKKIQKLLDKRNNFEYPK